MDSSNGTSSCSSLIQNSGSEEDLQALRKRRRMILDFESARRSRMRKKKHLEDLMYQVVQLKKHNQDILTSLDITTQRCLKLEAENSILRAQVGELSHRFQSQNESVDVNTCGTAFEKLSLNDDKNHNK